MVMVRGRGLLLGAVLESEIAAKVSSACLDEGVIVNAVRPDVIRFTPPLTISDDEIDEGVRRFGHALERVRSTEVTQ